MFILFIKSDLKLSLPMNPPRPPKTLILSKIKFTLDVIIFVQNKIGYFSLYPILKFTILILILCSIKVNVITTLVIC